MARIETELESVQRDVGIISADVRSLSVAIRQQGDLFTEQLRQLNISVVNAAAPRKLDYSVILTAIALVMAIGAAVLSPIYLQIASLQKIAEAHRDEFVSHSKLDMHPVGLTRINALERSLYEAVTRREKATEELKEQLNGEVSSLRVDLETKVDALREKEVPTIRERIIILESDMKRMEAQHLREQGGSTG